MQDNLSEDDLCTYFRAYIRNNIELFLNRSNKVDFNHESEESISRLFRQGDAFKKTSFSECLEFYYKNEREGFKMIFGGSYLPVFQAFNYLTEAAKHTGIELMMAYSTLSQAFDIDPIINGMRASVVLEKSQPITTDSVLMELSTTSDQGQVEILKDLRISFFLSIVKQRTGSLDCLAYGLLTEEKEVYEENARLLQKIDSHEAWRSYLS